MPDTEHVTVLFTDLVGSTALASSLSPDAADEVRRGHFSVLRHAIASSGGTEVKNLGDGLMVVFQTASHALECAVAMQQGVDHDNAGAGRPLGIRVGVSTGEATREADDYFGDPVIEAARLCAKAESGQILVTDLVRANAGRRSLHSFTSLGQFELKGLADPVETLEVTWEPIAGDTGPGATVPLPARLAHRPGVGVIGRDQELDLLSDALKKVSSGAGRELVLISGEPGQGKTTMVAELARRAHEAGAIVLLGRSDEEGGSPYRPFAEALGHLVTHARESTLRAHVESHGSELSRLVPALGRRLGDLPAPQSTDPDTERYLLYGAVVGLLETAGAEHPVILFLDDLHWADKPSLQLLRHVVANTSTARLLVLGTYRDAELSAAHPLSEALGALHREPVGVSTLALKGLNDTDVVAFLESAAGHELDETGVALAHQVYRETDGNPFFVAEVLRELSESRAIVQDATGRWVAKDPEDTVVLPQSVRTVIGTRVARLGEPAAKVLGAAAVIGRDFDLDLLAAATGRDEDDLLDLLDEAQRAALVFELPYAPGRYSFSHALIQHTLYEDLGLTRRTRLHRVVGEALEELEVGRDDLRLGELARHFILATRPADTAKAIDYARRAGEAALDALAPEEAVDYFTQALDLVAQSGDTAPSTRLDLLIALGTAQRRAGIADSRSTLLAAARAAREASDVARLARAALENNRGWFTSFGQVDTEKVEMLEAALAALPADDSPERARLLASLCAELNYGAPLERRVALADEAKAIARRLGDDRAFVDVVHRSGVSLFAPSTLAIQLADHDEAVAAAERFGDHLAASRSPAGYAIFVRAGRFDRASELVVQEQAFAEKLGDPVFRWEATYRAASEAMLRGDNAEAERLAEAALEIGAAIGQPDALSFYGVQLMCVRFGQGRYGELMALVTDAARDNPAIPSLKATLAEVTLHSGDISAARKMLDDLAATSFAFPEDTSWLDAISVCARVAGELGEEAHAALLFQLLLPYRDQVPHNGLIPELSVASHLGALATVLGRYDEAEVFFAEAAELNARGRMRLYGALTNLQRGQMLRRRNGDGDVDRARSLLEDALSSAAQHGYARIESQATEELGKLS